MERLIVIGTRGSKLALWQANHLKAKLEGMGCKVRLQTIQTKGDKIQDIGFDKMEGKGFFTKEIEDSLLNEEVDVAVHSLKDLSTMKIPGLVIGGLSQREDPADLLIINLNAIDPAQTFDLKNDAVIGTSSIRRKTQITTLLNGCKVEDLRGNVPTRIQKLRDGKYDAIILAAAGVNRLEIDLGEFKVVRLHPKEFVPAPGQGIVAFQCREADTKIRKELSKVHQKKVAECSNVERKVMQLMEGGCQVPLGVYCEKDDKGYFHAYGAWKAPEGEEVRYVSLSQSTTLMLAERVAEKLKA